MKKTVHLIAGVIATLCIATFFVSTVIVELLASNAAIATVKSLIVLPGLFILIPAIAATGATGFLLGRGRKGRLLAAKMRRMPFIAANGLLVLLPCAIVLDQWASQGVFSAQFYWLQGVELLAGAVNLFLMGMNFRDGLTLSGRLRR